MNPLETRLQKLYTQAEHWCATWGLSRLMRDVTIEFSDQVQCDLGRIDLKTMRVTLNGVLLLRENERLLHETLCHELAHAVTACRYGLRAAEHGVEWQDYMQRAGFVPRPHVPDSEIVRAHASR